MSFAQDLYLSDYLSEGELSRMMAETGHNSVDALPEFISEWDLASGTVPQTGVQLHTVPYPGDCNFKIEVEESSARNYTYSTQLNRLYIDMDKVVPVKFMWNGPATLHVRAMLVYSEPDHCKIPVTRCRMHEDKNDSSNHDYEHVGHVLRCNDEKALYVENMDSHRKSVLTILGQIPEGSDGVTVHYRLMCKTSCVAGINRRKTDIVFTLEDSNNHVIGRAVLGVKICSSPRRDKGKDEMPVKNKKRKCEVVPHSVRPGKVMKTEHETDNGQYNVYQIRVPENRSAEFEGMVARWLVGASLGPEALHQATFGAIAKL